MYYKFIGLFIVFLLFVSATRYDNHEAKIFYYGKNSVTISGIGKVPDSIWNDTNIIELHFNQCYFDIIPNDINKLKKLRVLDIRDCRLLSSFSGVDSLTQLEYLSLNLTGFDEIPSCLFDLVSLEVLDVSKTKIHSISNRISRLKKLEVLRINNNKIDSLPESIGSLKSLEVLWAGNTQIEYIPESMFDLPNIKTIWFDWRIIKDSEECKSRFKKINAEVRFIPERNPRIR